MSGWVVIKSEDRSSLRVMNGFDRPMIDEFDGDEARTIGAGKQLSEARVHYITTYCTVHAVVGRSKTQTRDHLTQHMFKHER